MDDHGVYELLDRPVDSLAATDRTVLAAMRGWVHALTLGGDPRDAAARALAGEPEATASFDRAMRALDRGSADAMTFQRPCYGQVDDTEAVLLAVWRRIARGETAAARATLRLLVDGPSADAASAAMARTAALLARAPVPRG